MTSSKVKIEIISKQNVKPSTPTPHNLRIYKLSFLDQLNGHFYIPFVNFYPQNDSSDEAVFRTREVLKKSLSQTLSHFYPLAGKLREESLHIECNDDGLYYVEAHVSDQLSNFLSQPKPSQIHMLLPFHPSCAELKSQPYLLMIQVSVFDCGGIAISLQPSHKLMDGQTVLTFVKAWAAQARGSSAEQIRPDLYTSRTIFVQDTSLPKDATLLAWPFTQEQGRIQTTRRFVFDPSTLAAFKAKTNAASRLLAVIGLIWKCALAASQTRWGYQKMSYLSMPVNLRSRTTSPPMSPYSIGNIFSYVYAHSMPNATARLDLQSIIRSLGDSFEQIQDDHFAKLSKGEERSVNVREILEETRRKVFVSERPDDADYFVATSFCNGGMYQADFGWGKPIWSCWSGAETDFHGCTNLILLMDTRCSGGIEAWVTLDEPNMKLLEKDPELLSFASLDPCPLQIGQPLPPRANL